MGGAPSLWGGVEWARKPQPSPRLPGLEEPPSCALRRWPGLRGSRLCEAVPSSQGARGTPPGPQGQPGGGLEAPAREGAEWAGGSPRGQLRPHSRSLSFSAAGQRPGLPAPTSLCTPEPTRPLSPPSPFSPSCRSPGRPFRSRPAASSGGPAAPSVPHPSGVALEAPGAPRRASSGTTMDQPRPQAQPKRACAVPRPVLRRAVWPPGLRRLSRSVPLWPMAGVQPLADASRQLSRPRSRRAAK